MLLPDMCSHRTGPDPLLNNLWTVWDNMQAFRTVLEEWLVRKIEDGKVVLDNLAHFEGLVDDLHNVIVNSQQLLGIVGMKEDEDK